MALPRKQDWSPALGAANRIERLQAELARILASWPGPTTLERLFTIVRSLRSAIRTTERRGDPDAGRPARHALRAVESRIRREFAGVGP